MRLDDSELENGESKLMFQRLKFTVLTLLKNITDDEYGIQQTLVHFSVVE